MEARRPRSLAKIFGTAVCVSGAMAMAFFKGPKLLGDGPNALQLLLHAGGGGGRWVAGALFLVGSSSCWSLWLILQVPICKSYVEPLALSAWMCVLSTLQSALLVSFLLPDPSAWRIHSLFELSCCVFSVTNCLSHAYVRACTIRRRFLSLRRWRRSRERASERGTLES